MLPFVICAALIYVPYYFFSASDLFSISLKYDLFEHSVYGLLPSAIILLAAFVASPVGSLARPKHYRVDRWLRVLLWMLLVLSLVVQALQLFVALGAYLRGGYMAARIAGIVEGVGIIIRLDLLVIPLLAAITKSRKTTLYILAIAVMLHLGRSVVMSERVALIEVVCLAWVVLPLCDVNGISVKKGLLGAAFIFATFSLLLSLRLDQQNQVGGKFDSNSTTFISSLSAYYADTTNKYYQVAAGDFTYPGRSYLAPVSVVADPGSNRAADYKLLLDRLESTSGRINSGLNNPGGLAQDASDFGLISYLVIAVKFFIFAIIWKRRYNGIVYLSLATIVLIAVLEYPRFNYLYMPFAAYLALISLALGMLLRYSSRRVNEAAMEKGMQ